MIGAAAIGLAAGVMAGMLGVGGGVLFVPALVLLLGLGQVDAESTSLLAIIPVALAGTWRQASYGNVRLGDGVTLGVLAAGGAVLGAVLANVIPERGLEIGFALLTLGIAAQLARRGLAGRAERAERAV